VRALAVAAMLLLVASSAHAIGRKELDMKIMATRADLERLRLEVEALRKGQNQNDAPLKALGTRLDALDAKFKALEESLAKGTDVGDRLLEVEGALEEVRADMVTSSELRKYQRKPDDKEFKSRHTQELELRLSYLGFRDDDIRAQLAALAPLAADPTLAPLLGGLAGIAGRFLASDDKLRPRLTLRLYWESNRFLSDTDFLYAYAMPELMLFVAEDDLARSLLPRDFARPRDRLGLIFKKAAIGLQKGRVRLSAGVLQLTHGSGFFLNPTNPFTPKDPLDPRKEVDGIPAAQLDWTPVAAEGLTLTLQLTGTAEPVRNDLLGARGGDLAFGGMAMLRADTKVLSLTAIALRQDPNTVGLDTWSFGGIASANPFGLTASVEALWTEAPYGGDYRPELIASIQGFASSIGPSGLTYVLEYYLNAHLPQDDDGAEVLRAILRGRDLLAVDRLTRALGRRQYLNLYVEPSLSKDLRGNIAALVNLDDDIGVLARVGFDLEYYTFVFHVFGGLTVGTENSELGNHVMESFGEVVVTAAF
jgi:hypothetical protein